MTISTSNIDFWEIKRYFTLDLGSSASPVNSPIPLGDFLTDNSNRYVNPEQPQSGGLSVFPTSANVGFTGFKLSMFSGINYKWNNNGTACTLEYVAGEQYAPENKGFTYSNGGADRGQWSSPHVRLMPKWRDDQTSGSGVAQNRWCLMNIYSGNGLNGGRFEILTPNGQNGTSNETGNNNWTSIFIQNTGNGSQTWSLNRSNATYTLVGDGYGYTTSSGYSVERWDWAIGSYPPPAWLDTTSDSSVYINVLKG